MGILDAPKAVNLIDVYPIGTSFTIETAWVEGIVPTSYGKRMMAKVMAAPADGSAPATEYAVWGSLCEQVQATDDAELPMVVKIVKDGKRHLFAAGEAPAEVSTEDALAGANTPAPAATEPPAELPINS